MYDLLGVVGGIHYLVNLVLSGNNVLIIGAVTDALPRQQRWLAILLGAASAIMLRLMLAVDAPFLLNLPLLQACGGTLLLLIAIRLLAARQEKRPTGAVEAAALRRESEASGADANVSGSPFVGQKLSVLRLLALLLTILVTDLTMSLDTVLALGALVSGNLPLLAVGVLLSIVILLLGCVVAQLIVRLSWLLDVAALALAWTGANMVLSDLRLGPWFGRYPWSQLVVPAFAFAVVLIANALLRLRKDATSSIERPWF